MKVKEVMTAKTLKSCSPETNLQEAANTMKAANCGVLPVTDTNKKVVGIVTDRDICLSLSSTHTRPHSQVPVSEVMEKKVHTVKESDDLNVALKEMRANHIGRLPVVDQDGKLKGILSLHNVITKTLDKQENLGNISSPGENVLKTIKALTDRYAKHSAQKEKAVAAW